MNISIIKTAAICLATCLLTGCTVKYTLSGASIPTNAKTVSIPFFPNNATLVAPSLSSALTDALQDKFIRQTKLELVPEDGDLSFEGVITNYVVAPAAITSNDMAATNRLTVTVKVTFKNKIDPSFDFTNRSFTTYQDYSVSQDLASAEGVLIPELVTVLVDDIFNAAVSNW